MDINDVTLGLAFIAGLASFLSPCVFALIPAYVGYLSGRSAAAGEQKTNSWTTLAHGFAFVVGFSIVFISMGLLAGALGGVLYNFKDLLVKVGGFVVIIFGLHMTSIVRIPFLDVDLRPQSNPDRQRGYFSSAMMGVFFSAGWSACLGPVIGAILTFALNEGASLQGGILLAAYSAGLAIPFLMAATQIGWVTTILRRYGKVMHYAEIFLGIVMIVLGVLLFTGRFSLLALKAQQSGFSFGDVTDGNILDQVKLVGQFLLIGFIAAVFLGLVIAYFAKRKGKNFLDWWFLGMGISTVVIILLYVLGAFTSFIPEKINILEPDAIEVNFSSFHDEAELNGI